MKQKRWNLFTNVINFIENVYCYCRWRGGSRFKLRQGEFSNESFFLKPYIHYISFGVRIISIARAKQWALRIKPRGQSYFWLGWLGIWKIGEAQNRNHRGATKQQDEVESCNTTRFATRNGRVQSPRGWNFCVDESWLPRRDEEVKRNRTNRIREEMLCVFLYERWPKGREILPIP